MSPVSAVGQAPTAPDSESSAPVSPPPAGRFELQAQLAAIDAQLAADRADPADSVPANLAFKAAQIRLTLDELTIAPGSYGARPEVRGLDTDTKA